MKILAGQSSKHPTNPYHPGTKGQHELVIQAMSDGVQRPHLRPGIWVQDASFNLEDL